MTDVRLAAEDDAGEVGRIFATGFADDPTMSWVFSDPDRDAKLASFFGFLAREALVPMGYTYLSSGCAAAWTPPDPPEWPPERGDRFGEELMTTCTPDDLERLGILDSITKEAHPSDPHWYLSVIGTEPAAQGKGLGSSVLAASLRMIDETEMPAYLESSNPKNVSFYLRHGFEITGEVSMPDDGPSLTLMWRDAR